MHYVPYQNIAKRLGLVKGDHILISSDVSKLAYICHSNGEAFKADLFIDGFIDAVGETGTLVFPTFNWGFCKSEAFDYNKTLSKTGSLTNAALKRKDFKRTKHPIYSFVVWGQGTNALCSLENKSSFGDDSPFAYFYANGFKNLFIDIDYQSSATFVHYCEEKTGVPYRFQKDFAAEYIDVNGDCEMRTYSMYVRPLDDEVTTTINPMHEVFLKNNAVIDYVINDVHFKMLDMVKAYDLIELDIKNNASRGIASYPGQDVDFAGLQMYKLAERLFPICRSITGNGVRETLRVLQEVVPQMTIHEVPSGTQAFDWMVPKEWNIKDAYIEDLVGRRIVSFSDNNLHVMGYSAPINKVLTLDELLEITYTLPDQPDLIPYVTSYYKERVGFCMSENQKLALCDEQYRVFIDSELKDGSLTYGEILIPGECEEEIFLSTYVCHPSLANNELSGPCVAIFLAKWLLELPRRYSYRIIFIPETIGSITYLSRNLHEMKRNTIAGFNLSCVGDDRAYSYIESRYGKSLADRVAKNILQFHAPEYITYSFLKRGSDERQYCAPGIDLPVCSICRSKFGEYPEYHTSADNLEVISAQGLGGAYNVYRKCVEALEGNFMYKIKCLGEPQLGRRGLYPTISKKGDENSVRDLMNFIAYADGENDLIAISDIINVPVESLQKFALALMEAGLLEKV